MAENAPFRMTRIPSMEIVSNKAKSALQAVSAKAEWVIAEIKADLKAVTDTGGSVSRDGSPGSSLPRGSGDLPWVGKTEHEKKHEKEFKRRILDIAKRPEEYLLKPYDEHLLIDMRAAMASAGAVLEEDEELKMLRFELVPKQMKEQEFWRRYFLAVKSIKQQILAEDYGDGSTKEKSDAIEDFELPVVLPPLRLETDDLEEEEYERAYEAVAIAPSMVVRRLASAVGIARGVRTMEDLANLEETSLEPSMQAIAVAEKWTASIKQSVGAGIAALGSLSGRERDKARERELGREREREKEKEMKKAQGAGMGQYHALLWSLFDADTQYVGADPDEEYVKTPRTAHVSFIEDIHGAPPDSFVPQLAEIIAGIKTEQRMAVFWQEVVKELRQRWQQGKPIPRLPMEANPDLHTCLLNQQLQLINCCMARSKRRAKALASLAEAIKEGTGSEAPSPQAAGSSERPAGPVGSSGGPKEEAATGEVAGEADPRTVKSGADLGGEAGMGAELRKEAGEGAVGGSVEDGVAGAGEESVSHTVARLPDGTLVRRLGVAEIVPEMFLLETGEPLGAPICQEGPVLTEDLIREAEELILRTGSSGAGCSQLFSDMQAFKAANPGCVIEDFVRWYSPLDWAVEPEREEEPAAKEAEATAHPSPQAAASPAAAAAKERAKEKVRGFLSARMQTEGNLWQELWLQAKALPAVKQAPLFDEELSAESTLDALDAIAPSDLFEQLFIAALGAGFAIALGAPQAQRPPLSTCLRECSSYVVATCTRGMSGGKLERLCQVYEVMETALHTPPEEEDTAVKVAPPMLAHDDPIHGSSATSAAAEPQNASQEPDTWHPQPGGEEAPGCLTSTGGGNGDGDAEEGERKDPLGDSSAERRSGEGGGERQRGAEVFSSRANEVSKGVGEGSEGGGSGVGANGETEADWTMV